MWLQNRDKTETQNALCNFSESPHMCKLPKCMAWCIMRLLHFAYIYTACDLLLLVWHIRLFYAFLACMGVEWVSARECKRVWRSCVFVSVDVKIYLCVINVCVYYNCMDVCAFVCVGVYILVFEAMLIYRLIGGIWAVIRWKLNLFVNWLCDCICMCICMW